MPPLIVCIDLTVAKFQEPWYFQEDNNVDI